MASAVSLSQKTLFVISGASRGIGRTLAIECAAKFAEGSVVVLLARSSSGLEETKAEILARNAANVTVILLAIDLTRPTADELANIFRTSLAGHSAGEFDLAMIVHNIGTIGDITKLASQLGSADVSVWQDYYSINVFSVAALNSAFLAAIRQPKAPTRVFVVNITSGAGIHPYKSFALYCSGKAAREMYFRVLALEEDDLLVLNYSPGPVDTDMTIDVQANSQASEMRESFKGMRDSNTLMRPIDTTVKFIRIVEAGDYKTGDHVRFNKYD